MFKNCMLPPRNFFLNFTNHLTCYFTANLTVHSLFPYNIFGISNDVPTEIFNVFK